MSFTPVVEYDDLTLEPCLYHACSSWILNYTLKLRDSDANKPQTVRGRIQLLSQVLVMHGYSPLKLHSQLQATYALVKSTAEQYAV